MHVKFEPIQRSYFFSQKNADSAGPRNIMKFQHFFKVHQISSNLQNLLESSSETCMWNLSPEKLFISADSAGPRNIMKFQHFFKVHQISSNLQNWNASETCMWNLSPFSPLKYHEISTFFQSFSSNLQKCIRKCMCPFRKLFPCRNIMKFQHFFKVHQISSNLQNLLESSSETCMWNLSPFREVDLFQRKMLTVPALEISWNFNIFSKFTKFHQTCRIYWNHHQKHACEIWAHSEKLT